LGFGSSLRICEGAFQFGGAFIGRADCESALERRSDYESALGSPASEPDCESGGFYNACPHFETHPKRCSDLQTFPSSATMQIG